MDNKSNILLTLYVLVILALLANARYHPTRFEQFQENENIKDDDPNPKHYRLPKSIVPTTYDIKLSNINFETSTFSGIVTIKANVKESVKEIVLNAGSIEVKVDIVRQNGTKVAVDKFESYDKTETFKIFLKNNLTLDNSIEILLSFNGKLRDDMIGFYRSSYYDEQGQQRWLAATQFESTHARHAFPCFDEPVFKAVFKMDIVVPDDYSCLSNMGLAVHNNTNRCQFYESPKMSTYLVAFLISDFEAHPNDEDVKMWARPNAVSQAVYGQKVGVKILQAFNKLFDVDYFEYMEKMDMVAVPDFSAGAMENWGLITYRETAGLYDEIHSSDIAKQRVASVIVHECTHMWFGNLVTPEWWTYLWLSEAFARYYQYMGTDWIEGNWNMNEQFIVEQFQTAMVVDSAGDSKPMTREDKDMVTPTQIGTAGGTITYNKGASIVRMMEKTFGTTAFNKALVQYINDRQFKSATPDHLWQALQKFVDSKLNVTAVMKTWTEQAGYPCITVIVESDKIKLRQDRFLLSEENDVPEQTWSVPITISSSSNIINSTEPTFWLSKQNDEIKRNNQADDWLIINVQSAGFYRVNYGSYWSKIIKLLTSENYNKILVENRAAIIDDLFNLARAEIVNYDLVFQGIEYLKRENHYLPFKTALTGLDYLTRVMAGSSDYDFLKKHVMSLIKNVYDELTFDDKANDDQLKILLRQELNNRVCAFDDASCTKKSLDYFSEWKKNNTKIVHKNQRSAVYCTAIRHGTEDDWSFLYEQYKKTEVAAEEVTILSALGCSEDPKLLKKYLLLALEGFEVSRIRKQDISSVFSGVYKASLKNAEFIIDFANTSYQALHKYYKNYDMVGSLINGALKRYPIKSLMDKVDKIVKTNAEHIKPNVASITKSLKFIQREISLFDKHLIPAIDAVKESNPLIENTDAYRLPVNVVPSSYDIFLNPHISPEKFTFDGNVKIIAKVIRTANKITLHADQLSNLTVIVKNIIDKKNPIVLKHEIKQRAKYHFTDIIMENPILTDTPISIEIAYTGLLNTEMRGFYRSSYKTKDGTRWLAATHLEPTGARRVFPCFDEPALKATFSISVQAPKNYNVISNSALKTEQDGLYRFETTPKMSTYLVAVVVSDFKSKSHKDSKHTYGVYANPLVINQTDYALEVMGPVTQWFEKKLGHDYSLSKMDMIALPDFTSGAMENWGLLTYRETNLLYDPARMSSLANMQSIRNVIAHEITHQWFGDLVSPHWWDYLWLNEGFARYFQCHAYTQDEEAWKLETRFVVDHLQTSFSTDGTTGTHPITHKVYSPAEIRAIFDKISYAKAASIIRMLEKLTGPTIFYKALSKYLTSCELAAGKPEDLFKAFQTEIDKGKAVTNFNVTQLMNSWTLQSGFPVLKVTFEDDDSVKLTQSRFYLRPKPEKEDDSTWVIPLTWTTKSSSNFEDTTKVTFLKKKTESVRIGKAKDDWVILNLQQMGYFRVNYDDKMWNLIIEALKSNHTQIHEVNRANIVDDLLHLGRAGHISSYDLVLSGLSYLQNETEYAPWKAAFTGLAYLNRRFAGNTDVYNAYKDFLLRLLKPTVDRLSFEDEKNDKPTDILLRHHVLSWLCNFDDEECTKKALESFKNEKTYTNLKNAVAPNKRSYVYCTAIKKGTEEDWKFLWEKFANSDYATEKLSALGALACSQDTELLNRLMNETIKENSEIRLQDAKTVFSNIVNNGLVGVETVMDYIQNNYKKMKEYLGDESVAKSTLTTISKRLSTDQLLKKFETLVNNSETTMPELSKSLKSSLKRAYEEKTWFNEKHLNIFKWLKTDNIKNEHRLPTFAKPEAYEISLNTYFEENKFEFDGEVFIDISVIDQTSLIVLHSHDLNIKRIIATSGSKEYNILHELVPSTQKLMIKFENEIPAKTTIKLKIEYKGKLREDMRGFYKSSYIDDKNQTKWIATTHFEPTYARRAFPCFDEPSFKAKFTLTITTPKGYHALSNMGSKPEKTPEGDRTVNGFKQSPLMSPYLLAFIVSEYNQTSDKSKRVSAWSRPQLKKYMDRAPPVGEAALKFLENFTNIDYPLEEMNLVSIPDFDMGAMENWGLVTFREYGLTYSQDLTSATYKRYVNIVISHELVHQWFGNLVTCEWWDYTWLNEGFAEYVAYLISHASEPKWELLKQFIIKELHVGLESDSSVSSHSMNNKVSTPTEAQDGFDRIAYQKSASVLRMLHHSFGEKVFVDAIRSYLKARSYNVAHPEHLYKAIEERMASEKKKPGDLSVDVTTVMKSWTDHAGYPVVSAIRKNDKVTLSQERFLISYEEKDKSKKDQRYWVPITYTTESEHNFDNIEPKLWLNDKSKEITVPSKDKWFLVNVQEIGFYRVNYNPENWQALIDVLNSDSFTKIVVVNRAQIIDDSFNLARAGHIKYEIAFEVSKYLARETNYLPWSAYFAATSYLSQRLEGNSEMKELYRKYVLSIIDNVYKKLGLKEDMTKDDHLDQLNRELISTWACKYGHKDCVDTARNFYSDKSTITPNVATAVYCTIVEHGDHNLWNEMYDKYSNSLLATDYLTILRALGCSKNAGVLYRYLGYIIYPNPKHHIRRQDAGTAFSSVYTASQVGLNTTIRFFVANIQQLFNYYGDWHDVGSLLTSLAGRITDDEHIKTLEDLLLNSKAANIKKSVESAIKVAKKNAKWFKDNSDAIHKWLKANTEENNTKPPPAPAPGNAGIQGAFYVLIFIVQIIIFVV